MLINHRTSAYVDAVEMERAAGMVEQAVNSGAIEDCLTLARYEGAGIALRILSDYDVNKAADFMTMFRGILGSL